MDLKIIIVFRNCSLFRYDVIDLSFNSLINPSKFEGWSSSMNKRNQCKKVILSNILVHKEQNPNRAKFFQVDNHIELSNILKEFLKFNKLEKDHKK